MLGTPLTRRRTPDVEFAFCEPSTAVAMGKIHIRRVGPEGLMLSGGAPLPTLCGRDLHGGWDLTTPVTRGVAEDLGTRRDDGHVWLCQACYVAYLTAVAP